MVNIKRRNCAVYVNYSKIRFSQKVNLQGTGKLVLFNFIDVEHFILCLTGCLSVCLYPINVKTTIQIGSKFCEGLWMLKNIKNCVKKSSIFEKYYYLICELFLQREDAHSRVAQSKAKKRRRARSALKAKLDIERWTTSQNI